MGKKRPINSEMVLIRSAQICMHERYGEWFTGGALYKAIKKWSGFEKDWNVTERGFTQALSLDAAYGDPHGHLNPVAQIRVLPESLARPYGVFYGCDYDINGRDIKPGVYNATWRSCQKKGRDLDLDIVRIRKGKTEKFQIEVRVIDYEPYDSLKKKLAK